MPEADKAPTVFDLFLGKSKDEATNFLNDKVLEQEETKPDETSSVEVVYGSQTTFEKQDSVNFNKLIELAMNAYASSGSSSSSSTDKEGGGDSTVTSLLANATEFSSGGGGGLLQESSSGRQLSSMIEILKPLLKSLDEFFKELGVSSKTCSPEAFFYYLEMDEERKTPSWKRRMHRFAPSFDIETIYALHDALYFAELSYVDTIAEIQQGVDNFVGASYELIYCTVEGGPSEPAHFICLKKELEPPKEETKSSWNPFRKDESFKCLDVLLVVRGTKEIGDMISDLDWDDSDYKNGKAHKGILEAGRFIVSKHTPLLKRLLEESKRDKIRMSLTGHSLGAGAAAIACLEFQDLDFVHHANSIGFGCPALLSKELSEGAKENIVTVVADSDAIPRMSGATIGNLMLDVMATDWTAKALVDVEILLDTIGGSLPFEVPESKKKDMLAWVQTQIENGRNNGETQFGREKAKARERLPVVLMPPGKCVHLYRDGLDISGSYMPCEFFSEIDASRTMLNDHYVSTGYNRLMHDLIRSHKNSIGYTFRNDVAALRVEKVDEEASTTK